MQAYYNILTNLKAKLEADEFVNTVTQGDIFDIDLTKQTIFPLAHIIVNDVTKVKNILQFNVTVMCMDIVDLSKDETTNIFLGNDNEQDVLNTQLAVGLRLVELLESGSGNTQFMMRGEPTFEGFTERFENNIAGWAVTFDIHVPNTMTSCDDTATGVVCYPANYTVEYANGTLIESGTIASGGSVTVTVPNCTEIGGATWTLTDTNGNTLDTGTIASGGTANITAPSANIQNSDGTYNVDVVSDGSLVLPNPDVIINDNNEGSIVSITDVEIDVTTGGSPTTPDSITITGNTVAIDLAAPVASVVGAKLIKTNQTISYATGDDGYSQEGRDVDFFTLNYANPFSNTLRFTDILGGTTYADGILIDWSTYDGVEVLGWRITDNGVNINWTDANTNAQLLTIGTFSSGWRLPNRFELDSIRNSGSNVYFNYSPFNVSSNLRWWTGTTWNGATTYAICLPNRPIETSGNLKTANVNMRYYPCRTFTVTGTTLT
jgi:hypothetical protein